MAPGTGKTEGCFVAVDNVNPRGNSQAARQCQIEYGCRAWRQCLTPGRIDVITGGPEAGKTLLPDTDNLFRTYIGMVKPESVTLFPEGAKASDWSRCLPPLYVDIHCPFGNIFHPQSADRSSPARHRERMKGFVTEQHRTSKGLCASLQCIAFLLKKRHDFIYTGQAKYLPVFGCVTEGHDPLPPLSCLEEENYQGIDADDTHLAHSRKIQQYDFDTDSYLTLDIAQHLHEFAVEISTDIQNRRFWINCPNGDCTLFRCHVNPPWPSFKGSVIN